MNTLCAWSCVGDPVELDDRDGAMHRSVGTRFDYHFHASFATQEECARHAREQCAAMERDGRLGAGEADVRVRQGPLARNRTGSHVPERCFISCDPKGVRASGHGTCDVDESLGPILTSWADTVEDCEAIAMDVCSTLSPTPAGSHSVCVGTRDPEHHRGDAGIWALVGIIVGLWVLIVVFYLWTWVARHHHLQEGMARRGRDAV